MGLELQDPKDMTIFSGKDLVWSEIHRKNGTIDRVAKIPLHRVPHFIKGEEMDPDAPCSFYRSQNKSPGKRDTAALRYEVYYCSYGPTDKREDKPAKRRVNSFVKKRGCRCHFIVKVMVKDPEVAILTYNMYEHEDTRGWPCHGRHDASGEHRSMHKPRLSRDTVSYVESCFSWDVSADSVYKMYNKKHVDMDAADRDKYATPSSCNAPPKISMDEPSHDVDAENTIMATNNVDNDVDALQLARQELFGYIQLIQNNPPVTLSKTEQMIGLVKRMLDEASNLSLLDYDFTLGLGAYESSLKRKKSFLSPKKKNKGRKQNSGLDIDLNVHTLEYEPYQFRYLKKRGRTQSKNASSIDLEATSMDHSIEGLAQLQHHSIGITAPSN